jgi:hypothetical protein
MAAARRSTNTGGFDKTTAVIVRLEEKVDRLERDFVEVKSELKNIQSALDNILQQMSAEKGERAGAITATKVWIAIIAAAVGAFSNFIAHITFGGISLK